MSKKKLDAAVIFDDDQDRKKTFTHDFEGFENLLRWIERYHKGPIHACTEFTEAYDGAVAEFLYSQGGYG